MNKDEEEKIKLVLLEQGKYGLNVEQIAQRVFPKETYDRALKDRIRAFLKDDPFIEGYGNTRGRYFRIAKDRYGEELSINEVKDAVYICFELSYQGIDTGSFRGKDFLQNLKEYFPDIHNSINNDYTEELNHKFLDSKWDQIRGDLMTPDQIDIQFEFEPDFEIGYDTIHWVINPDWMKKKKITVEIPSSIDIISNNIKFLLNKAVENVDYEIEGTVKKLNIENNISEILQIAMQYGYLESKITRAQVINFALLHFYRTLKSDKNIKLPNGYEYYDAIHDELNSHS